MARLPEYYQVGDRSNLTLEQLLRIVEDIYKDLAQAINQKPDLVIRPSNGLTTDTDLDNGTININSSTLKVEILASHPTISTVTWKTLS